MHERTARMNQCICYDIRYVLLHNSYIIKVSVCSIILLFHVCSDEVHVDSLMDDNYSAKVPSLAEERTRYDGTNTIIDDREEEG